LKLFISLIITKECYTEKMMFIIARKYSILQLLIFTI